MLRYESLQFILFRPLRARRYARVESMHNMFVHSPVLKILHENKRLDLDLLVFFYRRL